jgi:hypothetical protein
MNRIPPTRWLAALLLLSLAAACAAPAATTAPAAPSPTPTPAFDFRVPPGEPPTIDGTLSAGEWDGARVETFSDGSELFLLYSGGYLYLGVRGSKPELVAGNIYLDHGGEIAILHASAALGTAIYARQGESWNRTQDFNWRCRATDDGPAAVAEREAFFEEERWVAANSYMGTPNELEYKIEVATPTVRLAMNLMRSSNIYVKVIWPAALGDDISRPAPGEMPAQMQFDPEQWVTIGMPVSAGSALTGTGAVERSLLTYDDLMGGFEAGSPVDNTALALSAEAAPASHVFEGRLELRGESELGSLLVRSGDPDIDPQAAHLPKFDYAFVQSGDYLVPVQRGLIIADHPDWNLMLEPGRVWNEAGDGSFSRASFPFALVWKGSNAVFNGVMTFLFDDEHASHVWYQVTQETTVSLHTDLWGLLEAVYNPGPVPGADRVRADFDRELAARFPVKPIEALAQDYPGVDLTAFGRGVSPGAMTWYGFVVNGVNYVGGCETRYGPYPYCESMRAASYSTAKSSFVSVALMRLAQKYGPGIPDLLIKDYVPEAAESPGDWSKVTFNNTLDMATGNFRSAGNMVDEEHFDTDPFWTSEYYADLITAAFNWPHGASPGTQWVYRTSDTFILTRALQNYLETKERIGADIFDFVVEEIYRPLELNPGMLSVLRTKDDGWQGQPYGGLGMWWTPDDMAKLATFLNVDDGAIGGEQFLQPDQLAAALQRDPDDRGVAIGPNQKYNNAFWARAYTRGFDCEVWVPHMLGYSGIVVALFPNGTTYYYASDGREFTWDAALYEADKIISMCP